LPAEPVPGAIFVVSNIVGADIRSRFGEELENA